jgi:hypothetical protein
VRVLFTKGMIAADFLGLGDEKKPKRGRKQRQLAEAAERHRSKSAASNVCFRSAVVG